MITEHSADIIYLLETDTKNINSENDYQVENYKTIIQKKKVPISPTRIKVLVLKRSQ